MPNPHNKDHSAETLLIFMLVFVVCALAYIFIYIILGELYTWLTR